FAIGLALLALVGSSASLEQRAARAPAPSASLTALPSSAQAGISRVLGGDDPRYLARRAPDGFRFQNPRQGVRARFASSGLRLRAGSTQLALALTGYGYGSERSAVDAVRPTARGNRVLYRHRTLTEWYANGPLGLEQGFTLTSAPA